MLAALNLADDEGLLRWTPAYVKASVFMYDDGLDLPDISLVMKELSESGIVFSYKGGTSQQQLAFIVNFRKHQKINRPQPGKLSPPSLQNAAVREMYARRDGWVCALCGAKIPPPQDNMVLNLSLDHITPQIKGGSDFPSNIRIAHQGCNNGRKDKSAGEPFTVPRSVSSVTDSSPNSLNGSLPEGKGMEGKGMEGKGMEGKQAAPHSDPVYDFDADPEANIPDGLAPLQYATFVMEQAEILVVPHLQRKFAGAIELLAKSDKCGMPEATRRMLDRVKTAEAQGEHKWTFWLEEGEWKQKARASPATLGMNFTPPDERPLAEQMGPEWCAKVLRRHAENKTLTGLEAEYIRSLKLASK